MSEGRAFALFLIFIVVLAGFVVGFAFVRANNAKWPILHEGKIANVEYDTTSVGHFLGGVVKYTYVTFEDGYIVSLNGHHPMAKGAYCIIRQNDVMAERYILQGCDWVVDG